jgi:oleate hydratase
MKNYDRIHARKPEGIEERKAFIIGGGIAGLAATAFLIEDGHMPAKNITVYEQLKELGGSMDACGNAKDGYVSRGERELEPYMECLWYLFGMVPSLEEPGRTVLDETRECNKELPIDAKTRLIEKQFQKKDISTLGLTKQDMEDMAKMAITPESVIEDVTIEQWFKPSYFKSNLWYYWSSMLAFQSWHSLIEMKRYTVRFMQHLDGIERLKGILRTKYNQYDSLILPLITWLKDKGVNFVTNTTVVDMKVEVNGNGKTVTALTIESDGKQRVIPVAEKDLVFFTNGSMTQNSTQGSMQAPAVMNRSVEKRGCFTLWEKLARVTPVFGNPAKFISNPDASSWVSYTATITDYPQFFKYIEEKTGNVTGTAGAITMTDSSWFMTIGIPVQPIFPKQPDNVEVFWGYGLHSNEIGDYIKKPMTQCSGEEILQELLHHLNLSDKYEEMRPHFNVIPVMMPYITSQFMPRGLKDRPEIIPDGSTNLAFIGQFVELEGDVVFTVETSIRTAMIAVYRMLELDKPITPLFEAHYDIRIIMACVKKLLGVEMLTMDSIPLSLPGSGEGPSPEVPAVRHDAVVEQKVPFDPNMMLLALNMIPKMPSYYPEQEENKRHR